MTRRYFETLDPTTLRPQPRNPIIYGDIEKEITPQFIASIKLMGVMAPILVTSKKMICDGHRRTATAIKLGMKGVPCYVSEYEDIEQAIKAYEHLQKNHRELTPEQRIRLWKTDEPVDADEPVNADEPIATEPTGISGQNWPEIQTTENTEEKPVKKRGRPKVAKTKAQAEDEAAKKHGLGSRATAQLGSKVVEAIDNSTEQGDTETANELRSLLNDDSIGAAATKLDEIEKAKAEPVTEPKDANGKVLPERLHETFAKSYLWESVLSAIKKVSAEIKAMSAEEHEEATHKLNKQQAANDLKNLTNQIRYSIPYAICPYCKGSGSKNGGGCQACKGVGWVVKLAYDSAPEDMKG